MGDSVGSRQRKALHIAAGSSVLVLGLYALAAGIIREEPLFYPVAAALLLIFAGIVYVHAGIRFKWEKTPAARQLDILKANKSKDCLIGWFKNPDREKFAKYSDFIYQDKPTIALARSDNPKIQSGLSIESVLSNAELILLVKSGYSYGQFIDSKINRLFPRQMVTESENLGMLRMVHSGRADYFFISEEEAMVLSASSGLLKSDFQFIRFSDVPPGNKRYLLFSQKVDDEVITKINQALKNITHKDQYR